MSPLHASLWPPFPPDFRASGILAHVTSLPSDRSIGDFGPSARQWIDVLQAAGQTWWQILPLGPVGDGDSPYCSPSSFAANELLISPDDLIEDGLLQPGNCDETALATDSVDYAAVLPFRRRLVSDAWRGFAARASVDLRAAFEAFCCDQCHWLDDYALFCALKARYGGRSYLEWPSELVRRDSGVVDAARRQLAPQCERIRFGQFLAFRQIGRLKDYAHAKGVHLLGDLPFYVSSESSDVWAEPQLFRLDERRRPLFVAGVPPDYFSAAGQLWGNPVYDWEALRRTGYRWWIDRLRALLAQFDMVRLDHFRAFAAGWHVPAGSATAQPGSWVAGPGADFFTAAQAAIGRLPFVAEDLGVITPDVVALRDRFGLPGMRVLQFAFDGSSDNPHLPANYGRNAVVYTGTHDNSTSRGWFESLPEWLREKVWKSLQRPPTTCAGAASALIEAAWCSSAALAIAPLQDLLNLGDEARMNRPGEPEGNWRWRCTPAMLTPGIWQRLRNLTVASSRACEVEDKRTLLGKGPDIDQPGSPRPTPL
ncbi:MAG: 4-alpha-glucanotransferase [Alphaproteobacteria bacterium]|nr:4-alpha-glucanotransferase [Alphaproteobacteria bacterium]MBV8407917.1 4-alpha-glucanotransferase [Alphaproteobacteria bacterium]